MACGDQPVYRVSEKSTSPSSSRESEVHINRQLRAAWSRRGKTSNRSGRDQGKRKKRKHFSQQEVDRAALFLGSRSKQEVTKLLKPQSFVLFYPLPEDEDSVVVSLRLELAYKKTDGKTFFYPVIRQKTGWAVDFDDNHYQPTFDTLIELIEYHTIYSYVDVASQRIETFPFPEVAEESQSDDTVFELSVEEPRNNQ